MDLLWHQPSEIICREVGFHNLHFFSMLIMVVNILLIANLIWTHLRPNTSMPVLCWLWSALLYYIYLFMDLSDAAFWTIINYFLNDIFIEFDMGNMHWIFIRCQVYFLWGIWKNQRFCSFFQVHELYAKLL
jgi:hypothetical protein